MSAKIIISYDGTENDHDALALGRMFADRGATIALAYVRHTTEPEQRREQLAHDEADALLERGARWLGHPEAERHVVMSACTGEGLRGLAEREGADIVVFGSDVHTAPGSVSPGRSAQRMLNGAPVAIAVAAARLRDHADASIETVALAGGVVDPAARSTAESLAGVAGTSVAGPCEDGVDLIVIGSQQGACDGRVALSAAMEYVIETARASVLVVPRGRAIAFDSHVVGVA